MTDGIILRDGLLLFRGDEEASAVSKTNHARRRIRIWVVKFSEEGRAAALFAECVYIAFEAGFDRLPCDFRGPLSDLAGYVKG